MNEIQSTLERYLHGRADLEDTATQLLELWKSQGWSFYLSPELLPPDQLARAKLLEQRFAELANQATPSPGQ